MWMSQWPQRHFTALRNAGHRLMALRPTPAVRAVEIGSHPLTRSFRLKRSARRLPSIFQPRRSPIHRNTSLVTWPVAPKPSDDTGVCCSNGLRERPGRLPLDGVVRRVWLILGGSSRSSQSRPAGPPDLDLVHTLFPAASQASTVTDARQLRHIPCHAVSMRPRRAWCLRSRRPALAKSSASPPVTTAASRAPASPLPESRSLPRQGRRSRSTPASR